MKFLIETPSNSIFIPFKYVQFTQKLTLEENALINFLRPDVKIFCDQCLSILYQEDVSIFTEETEQGKEKKTEKDYCIKCFCSYLKSNGKLDALKMSKGRYFVRNPGVNCLSSTRWRVTDDILLLLAIKKFGYGNWNKMSYFMQTHGCYINSSSYQNHFLTYFSEGLNLTNFIHNPNIEINTNESSEDSNKTENDKKNHGEKKKKKQIEKKPLSDHFLQWKGSKHMEKESMRKTEVLLNMENIMTEVMSSFEQEDSKEHLDSNLEEDNPLMYIPERDEFLIDHDPYAESLICDLEFNENDVEEETRMKEQLLLAYNEKLKERKKRKMLAVNHNLVKSLAQAHKKKQNSEEFFLNKSPEESITAFLDPFFRLFRDEEEIRITKTLITNHYNVKEIIGTLSWVKKHARVKLSSLHSLENIIKNTLENQPNEKEKMKGEGQYKEKKENTRKKVAFEDGKFIDSLSQQKLEFIQSQILSTQSTSAIYQFRLDTKNQLEKLEMKIRLKSSTGNQN